MNVTGFAPDQALGAGLALVAMLMFGVSLATISVLMRRLGSGPGSLLSSAAGVPVGLALVGLQFASRAHWTQPPGAAFWAFALAGVLSTYLGRWLVFKSVELIGPTAASALQTTSPLITAVFAWLLLGEHIRAAGVLGLALGIAGLVSTSLGIQRRTDSAPGLLLRAGAVRRPMVAATLVFGLASATAYAGSQVARAFAVRQWNEPIIGTALGAIAGLLALLLASRHQLAGYRREIAANRRCAAIYLAVGVLQFGAQALVIASMKYIPASTAALISMCTPLVIMPISYFALGNREQLNGLTVLGVLITLAGVSLVVMFGRGVG